MSVRIVEQISTDTPCPAEGCDAMLERQIRKRFTAQSPEGIRPEVGHVCPVGGFHVDPHWAPVQPG